MSILNVNKINPVGGGSTITIAGIASVTGSVTATGTITGEHHGDGSNLTGINGTTITVADESTDTTCNPLFVTTTSGNLAPKTGTNLVFNSVSGRLGTGSLFLGTGSNESKTQDGVIIERNSGDGLAHITAGRSGGNYSGMNFYIAGASGVTLRHLIDYQSNFRWYAADGTTERMRVDNNGNLKFNSGYGQANTAYGVRAWINFKAAGGSNTVRGSGNATITDHGTGDFTMNFTTAMPDTGYTMNGTAGYNSGVVVLGLTASGTHSSPTTSGFRFTVRANYNNASLMDEEYIHLVVVR